MFSAKTAALSAAFVASADDDPEISKHWFNLLAFPICLRAKESKDKAKFIRAWPNVSLDSLTTACTSGEEAPPQIRGSIDATAKAERLVRASRVGSAYRALKGQSKVHRPSPALDEKLTSLMPRAEVALDEEWENCLTPGTTKFDDKVGDALLPELIRHIPSDAGMGIFGWSPQFMKSCAQHKEFLKALTRYAELWINGDPLLVEWTMLAVLIPLDKHKGDTPPADGELKVRPICVGSLINRTMSRLIQRQLPNPQQSLLPYQLGVGSKGGVEPILHYLHLRKQDVEAQPEHEWGNVITLDQRNAFNTMNRNAIAYGARKWCPELYPWVVSTLRAPQHSVSLDPRDPTFRSSEVGTPQGHVLSPWLFSLGLRFTLDRFTALLREEDPQAIVLAYLDDITVDSQLDQDTVVQLWHQALDVTSRPEPAVGLELNQDKTVAMSWKDILSDGIELLGSVVGPKTATVNYLREQLAKHERNLSAISVARLDTLLRVFFVCANDEHVFTMRNIDPKLVLDPDIAAVLRDFDSARVSRIKHWMQEDSLEDHNLKAIGLPRRHGGCGMTAYSRMAEHAASAACQAAKVELVVRRIRDMPDFDSGAMVTSQKARCETMHKSCVADLLKPGILSPTQCRQLVTNRTSQAQTVYLHQSRWVPRLSDVSWVCELRHRALLPDRPVCPRCDQDPQTLGHAPHCMSSVRHSRHDTVVDSFKVTLSSYLTVSTEVPVAHDLNPNLRADLKVTQRAIADVQAAATKYYDLTIVESQCTTAFDTYTSSTSDCAADLPLDRRATLQLESLVNAKYTRKLNKYHGFVVPLVVTSEGYMHKEFLKFITAAPGSIRTRLRSAVARALLIFRGFRRTALPQVSTSIN